MYKKAATAFLILILLIVVATPVATLLRKQPTLAAAIRTWSMTPLLTRGDLLLLLPAGENTHFKIGQIVVFRPGEGAGLDWIMHRIVGGNAESGFITKGDANERTDQDDHYPSIRPEWIAGVAPTFGTRPLMIPLLGYLPLLLEANLKNPLLLPVLTGVLALALVIDEILKPRKKRKQEAFHKSQLYFLGGLAFAVLMAALMLMGSLFLTFPYGVEKTAGTLMGSEVGVLELGDSRELTLAELKNEGAVPSFYYVVSRDPQVVVHREKYFMRGGDSAQVMATVYAKQEGLYQAGITVGMFMPFLPPGVIGFLAEINFWLALVIVALVPALPLFILPYLEPRYRRRVIKTLRKKQRQTFSCFRR